MSHFLSSLTQFTAHAFAESSLFVSRTLASTNKRLWPLLTFWNMCDSFFSFWFVFTLKHFWTPDELLHSWQRTTPVIFLPVIRSFVMIRWYFRLYYKICFYSFDKGRTVAEFILITERLFGYLPYKIHDLFLPHASVTVTLAMLSFLWNTGKTAISVTNGHWFGGWFTSSEIFLGNGVHNDSTIFLKERKKSEKEKKSFIIFSWLNQLLFLYAYVCVCVCVF